MILILDWNDHGGNAVVIFFMELTPRQVDVITIIRNHRHLHGYAPSIRELAAALNICRATTVQHIKALTKKNLLRSAPRKSRTLEVVADSQGVAKNS